jgi:hypothetical protein
MCIAIRQKAAVIRNLTQLCFVIISPPLFKFCRKKVTTLLGEQSMDDGYAENPIFHFKPLFEREELTGVLPLGSSPMVW